MTHLRRQLLLPQPTRRQLTSAGGFALPVVLVAGFVATLGAVTLSRRVLSTRVGDEFQAQSIAAREAADSGMEAVISELNKIENRRLAGSNVAMHAWSANNPDLRNQCYEQGDVRPTARALASASGAWQTNLGNENLRYRIRSAEVKTALRRDRLRSNVLARTSAGTGTYSPDHINTSPSDAQFSRLELTVEGQSLRDGQVQATSAVTSELNVRPKNCDGAFPRLLIGLNGGGVIGAANDSRLREQVSGSTATNNNKKLDSVLCINNSGTCGGNIKTRVDGVPIKTIKLTLPSLPQFPEKDTRTGANTGNNGIVLNINNNANSIPITRNETYCTRTRWGRCIRTATRTVTVGQSYEGVRDYMRVNSAGRVELCNVANNNTTKGQAEPNMPASFVNGSCSTAIDQYCARTGDKPENYAYHCRIARLHVSDSTANDGEANRIQNNTFFIDTSQAPIYLHFNTPWASPAACGLSKTKTEICTEDNWDDGQIQHVYCPNKPAGPCNQRALPDDSPRATLYSNKGINVRIGDDGYIRDLFMYLPKGHVTLAEDPDDTNNAFGTPNFRGSMWINNLTMSQRNNYTTAISVPPSSDDFYQFGRPQPSPDNPFKLIIPPEWLIVGRNSRTVYSAAP